MSSNLSTVEHPVTKHCPILTGGELTPQTLLLAENAFNEFFIAKNVSKDDEVKLILGAFKDVHIRDWIATDRERLLTLTFDLFMSELRTNFLPTDWVESVRMSLLGMRMTRNMKFWDFAQSVRALNIVLRGTPSHLGESALQNQLEAGLEHGLQAECAREELYKLATLKEWIERVRKIDERLNFEKKRYREIFAEESNLRANKRPALGTSRVTNTNSSQTPASASSTQKSFTRLPKLTDAEKDLLRAHAGCFKCRRFNAGHNSSSPLCTGFPSGAGYKTITKYADAAGQPATRSITNSKNKVVAATLEEVESDEENVVAAFSPSAALGNGTDSGGSDSVSDLAPLKCKHFTWSCLINGPLLEFPLKVSSLVDNGCHLVLIRPEIVEKLGLPILSLDIPETVNVAIKDHKRKEKLVLEHFVILTATSLDGEWCSKRVRALIAPNLCMPLIFGLPFLVHNNIVTDHSLRSCIDKKSGYNLLNPIRVSPPSPKLSPKEKRTKIKKHKREFLRELRKVCDDRLKVIGSSFEQVKDFDFLGAIKTRIETLAFEDSLRREDTKLREEFKDLFKPIPHVNDLPTDFVAEIKLKDPGINVKTCSYPCPRKYRDAWQTLLNQHLAAGRIRPSSSSHASPAFIIPKADPSALPRWVNDYRQLNSNTVVDSHPLPRVDDILNDCAKGKFFSTIDMTNSFFQTRMKPEDIPLTAVSTPFGLYEWTVMPMGLRNAPSIHQRRVTHALRGLLGRICHIYLDDIIIWSTDMTTQITYSREVFEALRRAKLYINPQKTKLFRREVNFLGHHISENGIAADTSKVDKILSWPIPKSATQARSFLGMVRYMSSFLPNLAEHTAVLTTLTTKTAEKLFPAWTPQHQAAFDGIKKIVVGRGCLTTIDFNLMPENKIYVTTDASDTCSGALLSFGPTWESARPVAFDSTTFKGAELNYPIHEKELLAVIRALRKWRSDLVGSPFFVFTDNKTLENFHTQKDLSRRQARWMEFLSQYDAHFVYIQGVRNSVADALSRRPTEDSCFNSALAEKGAHQPYSVSLTDTEDSSDVFFPEDNHIVGLVSSLSDGTCAPKRPLTLSISADQDFLSLLRKGYEEDSWTRSLSLAAPGMPNLRCTDGLWFLDDRLVVPNSGHLRETLFRLAHDNLGHFGFDKSYEALRHSYYWPKMRKELESAYVPSCIECQRNKSSTTKPIGPLHPLPVPDARCDSVAIDFIGPLPMDEGFNYLMTLTDRLGSDVRLVPCTTSLTAEGLAEKFFVNWYCENGLPTDIISDRDKLFLSRFWKALHKLTGVKLKLSTSYHPETDGSSERTNKTVNQCLRFHVERNQTGWVKSLPMIRFNIMSTVNKSTGFSPFQLRLGRTPRIIPPLIDGHAHTDASERSASEFIKKMHADTQEARDNLSRAKISQAVHSNRSRTLTFPFKVGDRVKLSTFHRRREFKASGEHRVAKFMPRFDGPYTILETNEATSSVKLELPPDAKVHPVFHTSLVLPYKENDSSLFPSREFSKPLPVIDKTGACEYFVRDIIDEKRSGRGFKYLVRWVGYGEEENRWLARKELEDTEALDIWLAQKVLDPTSSK